MRHYSYLAADIYPIQKLYKHITSPPTRETERNFRSLNLLPVAQDTRSQIILF
jgi:hypothetical protein